ncbi:MAG: M61 family peptidase [Acidobacteriia bacterium]|nr:M61 family peptidase [Terriglobia bacterium]
MNLLRFMLAAALMTCAAAPGVLAQSEPVIKLSVDATTAPHGIFHARLSFPVKAGPFTLLYPKWIPGEHSPTGPNVELTGIQMHAAGKPVAWRRDSLDMYTFHCEIPKGVETLEVSLDYLSPNSSITGNGYGFTPNATAKLAIVPWNQVLLYPAGVPASMIDYQTSLKIPSGWKIGTALPIAREEGGQIDFEKVSLGRLVDSPVLAGEYFRVIPLTPSGDGSVEIDVAADSSAALQMKTDQIEKYKHLVQEANTLFGGRHYHHYHFLLALSDGLDSNGLEHPESSDDRAPERTLIDSSINLRHVDLLAHEYTHSWNGKFRRPEGLAAKDYEDPMKGDLLWVYEGMTQYWGSLVLTGRSGLRSPEQSREYLASVAARLDNEPGRTWRPLEDTAVAAQVLYGAPEEWSSWRRGVDFYEESLLIWLDADTLIRDQSHHERSLNDFAKSFFGVPGEPYTTRMYTFEDVVSALNGVMPHNWNQFLNARLHSTSAHAPLDGLERGGWELVYTDQPNEIIEARETADKTILLNYSLGFSLTEKGNIVDVIPGSPAAKAGLSPGMTLAAVNGRKWTPEVLHEAVAGSKTSSHPLELLAVSHEFYKTYSLNYHGGERYPHLERITGQPDLLGDILAPLSR